MNGFESAAVWSAGRGKWLSRQVPSDWAVGDDVRLVVASPTARWRWLGLPTETQELIGAGNAVRVSALVSGASIAAGFAYRGVNYTTPLAKGAWARRLSLDIGADGLPSVFTVDGVETAAWEHASIASVDGEGLSLVTFGAADVTYEALELHQFEREPTLSIVITSHRFLQRLRVSLLAWARQEAPTGSYEVIIVNSGNADGMTQHIAAVAGSYPEFRVRQILAEGVTDKGKLINKAAESCRGDYVWMTDADCLFSDQAVSLVLSAVEEAGASQRLFFAERRHLRRQESERLLAGRTDGVREFAALLAAATERAPQAYPWGYTQIVASDVLRNIGYSEAGTAYAHSDGLFVDACESEGLSLTAVDGLICIHMAHPFAWYGTDSFL
jgi:hypothetical protein